MKFLSWGYIRLRVLRIITCENILLSVNKKEKAMLLSMDWVQKVAIELKKLHHLSTSPPGWRSAATSFLLCIRHTFPFYYFTLKNNEMLKSANISKRQRCQWCTRKTSFSLFNQVSFPRGNFCWYLILDSREMRLLMDYVAWGRQWD